MVSNDMRKLIASNIAYYRKAKRLSQAELGQKLGLARNSVSDLETGDTQVTAVQLINICEALGVPVAVMFEEPDAASRDEDILLSLYRDDDDFKTAVDLLIRAKTSSDPKK